MTRFVIYLYVYGSFDLACYFFNVLVLGWVDFALVSRLSVKKYKPGQGIVFLWRF